MQINHVNFAPAISMSFRPPRANADLSPQRLKPRWLGYLFQSLTAVLLLTLTVTVVKAQTVQWKLVDTYPGQPADKDGEDWWNFHQNSYDANHKLNGFICAGYSSFRNSFLDETNTQGCFKEIEGGSNCRDFEINNGVTKRLKGTIMATMSLISPDGSQRLWTNAYLEGQFFKVIQTSDGGYLGVGETGSTRTPSGTPIAYNPNQLTGAITNYFCSGGPGACPNQDSEGTCSLETRRHMFLVKTDSNGGVQWQYLYGMFPYAAKSMEEFRTYSQAFDVTETATGFVLVGNSYALGHNDPYRAAIIEVDKNGYWKQGKFIGPANVTSDARAISKYYYNNKDYYLVAGHAQQTVTSTLYRRGYLYLLDNTFSIIGKKDDFDASDGSHQLIDDVQVNTSNEVLLPIVERCNFCEYAVDDANIGIGKVYRLTVNNSFGFTINSITSLTWNPNYDPLDVKDKIWAKDLKLRVVATSDGGFGAVSTKRLADPDASTVPVNCGDFVTTSWNTDAYLAKANAQGQIEWTYVFDVNNQPAAADFPGDVKKQECLFAISQDADGGFVLSGTSSFNFDDYYLVKVSPPKNNALSIRDTTNDTGIEPNPNVNNEPMWTSVDIWIRKQNDCETTNVSMHENPEYNAMPNNHNYVCIQVKNNGSQQPAHGFLKVYWAKASTSLEWPKHWNGSDTVCNSTTPQPSGGLINNTPEYIHIAPSAPAKTYAIQWDPPNPNNYNCYSSSEMNHFCLLARIETTAGMAYPEVNDVYANVINNNKIAWKNVTVVDDDISSLATLGPVILVRGYKAKVLPGRDNVFSTKLAFDIPKAELNSSFLRYGTIQVDLGARLFKKWVAGGRIGNGVKALAGNKLEVQGANSWIGNLKLQPDEVYDIKFSLAIKQPFPSSAPRQFGLDVSQFLTDRNYYKNKPIGLNKVVGGVSLAIKTKGGS